MDTLPLFFFFMRAETPRNAAVFPLVLIHRLTLRGTYIYIRNTAAVVYTRYLCFMYRRRYEGARRATYGEKNFFRALVPK